MSDTSVIRVPLVTATPATRALPVAARVNEEDAPPSSLMRGPAAQLAKER